MAAQNYFLFRQGARKRPNKMIILKALEHLHFMRKILYRELPQSITVIGGVSHILHNNLCHMEVCVDSWPTFTTAICYRQKQPFSSSSGAMTDTCTFFTKNPAALRSLLLNERVLNWRHGLMFKGVPKSHCPLVKEIASLRGLDITEYGGYNAFICHSPDKMELQRKELPLPISTLDESHAELVDRHLHYGGSQESLNLVRSCIRHLPNACVKDEEGRPVSWLLSDELCELRMGFTLPEYRRAGHLIAISQALIRRMSSLGLPIYGNIHQQNQATINAVTALGFSACSSMEEMSVQITCKDRV